MKRTLTFRLGGVRTHLAGLEEPVRESLRRRYARFLDESPFGETADLVISVRPAPPERIRMIGARMSGLPDRAPGLPVAGDDSRAPRPPAWSSVRTPSSPVFPPASIPLSGASDEPRRLESELKGDRVLLHSAAFDGSFSLAGGEGELHLRESHKDPPHESIESFLRVALSWRLLLRQAVLVRAIGILDSSRRARVLVNPLDWSDSDRARLSKDAPLLSDEYLVLDRRNGVLFAHALPASREAESMGAWPDRLPGYLSGPRPVALQSGGAVETVEIDRAPGAPVDSVYIDAGLVPGVLDNAKVTAAFLACMPHVNSNARGASRAIGIIRSLLEGVPVSGLTQGLEGSFWQAISAGPAGPTGPTCPS